MNYQIFYNVADQEMYCGVSGKLFFTRIEKLNRHHPVFFGLLLFLLFFSIFYELLIDVCSPLHISHSFISHTLEHRIANNNNK
jgi:hypothetical protein